MTDTDLEDTGLRAHEHLEWKKTPQREMSERQERVMVLHEAF